MRARNIKPGFFKNEFLAELDPYCRLLFAGLWCMADREGRLEDRPKRIAAEVFPYESVEIEKLLEQLGAGSFIVRYRDEEAGISLIWIPEFVKHQNPHKNEKPSQYRSLEDCRVITGAVPYKHHTTRADSPINDSLIPDLLKADVMKVEEETEPQPQPPEKIVSINNPNVSARFFQLANRQPNAFERTLLVEMQQTYSTEELTHAFKEAGENGVSNLKYVKAILEKRGTKEDRDSRWDFISEK